MKDRSGRPLILFVTDAPAVAWIHGMSRSGEDHAIVKHKSHAAMVHLLVRHGAKVNVKDKNGWTPLLQAQASEETGVVAFLKKAGARE